MDYKEFLASKRVGYRGYGFDVPAEAIHPLLFDWQRDIVRWALRKGRAALFEECGLGKTLQQLEWARHVAAHTSGKVLILAPLAVAHQTIREGAKIGVPVRYVRSQDEAEQAEESIIITNYDMLKAVDPAYYHGVVLDESSILKSFTGHTKRLLLDMFSETPYRLCCTATPAPNDHLEFGNHADFLGVMASNRMISRWFINDSMEAGHYRLKAHAARDFWRWMTTWVVCIAKPSDLGSEYTDDGFIIPDVNFHEHVVRVDHRRAWASGQLLLTEAPNATSMWKEKRETAEARCQMARDVVDGAEGAIIWCDTNDEADRLMTLFPDAVEVRGSDRLEDKEAKLRAFSFGEVPQIITKADIAGFGLNWQHCAKQVFVGVTYSFEKTYQALRRSWRYGQTRNVQAHLIYAETEGNIMEAIASKQAKHQEMQAEMTRAQHEAGLDGITSRRGGVLSTERDIAGGDGWTLYLGDSIELMPEVMADNSVDLSIFSPPFSTLYIYTDTEADMGNNEDHEQFFEHFRYLIPELWRVTKPGRLCVVHCKDLPLYMNRDGAAGLYDFPGRLIQEFEALRFGSEHRRWAYHSRVTIWKDPVIEMQRTKNHGLLWRNFSDRGEVTRQGMADYIIVFRKWLDRADMPDKQVNNSPTQGDYIGTDGPQAWDSQRDWSIQVWQKYASPVWFDINQTRVLNYRQARADEDEKHICPLQLDVIERCIEIWSNPGDVIFSPFAGIGSEPYCAIKRKRRAVGMELKREYWEWAIRNCEEAEQETKRVDMFEWAGIDMAAQS